MLILVCVNKVVWKSMILNFMERYFYLICFATYALEQGDLELDPESFQKPVIRMTIFQHIYTMYLRLDHL
jgi:hypothetical protein